MGKKEITVLELTPEETAYVIYSIGFAYAHISEFQRSIVRTVLRKIADA